MSFPIDDAVTGPLRAVPMAPTVGAGPAGPDPWARPSPLSAPAGESGTVLAVDTPIEADSLATEATVENHVGWNFADVLAGLGALLLLSQLLAWPFLADPHLPAELRLVVAGFLPVWLGWVGPPCWWPGSAAPDGWGSSWDCGFAGSTWLSESGSGWVCGSRRG